jgi:chemotaxis protein methyltransferase CheR
MDTIITNSPALKEEDFFRISNFVYQHCGINLHDGKRELVHARLSKRLRNSDFDNFSDYIDYVFNNPDEREFSLFIDSLSTNLTSFFREEQHFDLMSDKFLPDILKTKEKNNNLRLRIWSAGCSSGQEPYSVAITLSEAVKNNKWDIKILATDISKTMLETAENGLYEEAKISGISAELRNKYFSRQTIKGQKYFQAMGELKDMIIFKHLNLMEDWPVKGPIDFIFCRNVMIYFDKPTQQKLVERFWNLLSPGGILFTGHSESLTGIKHSFKYISPTVYMKA